MISTIILSTVLVGIGELGTWQSMLGHPPASQTVLSFGSIHTRSTVLPLEVWKENLFDSHRLYVQRESSRSPGESRTGRASSGPASGVIDSKRESSRPSDVTEDPSKQSIVTETEKGLGKSEVAPKKSHDPTEGGGETPSSFKRRGGVR